MVEGAEISAVNIVYESWDGAVNSCEITIAGTISKVADAVSVAVFVAGSEERRWYWYILLIEVCLKAEPFF